jgi:hypothetical protein
MNTQKINQNKRTKRIKQNKKTKQIKETRKEQKDKNIVEVNNKRKASIISEIDEESNKYPKIEWVMDRQLVLLTEVSDKIRSTNKNWENARLNTMDAFYLLSKGICVGTLEITKKKLITALDLLQDIDQ